jgi:thiamine pyrophosphate-dependent acetolactate synthase large subunit-like protein
MIERARNHGEVPIVPPPADVPMGWGSDAVAELLNRLAFDFISLNPGASYRGLHDSLVNVLGARGPQIVLCLHEEHAVALAHGYAKVAERPMAVALHSNVGLMHATMALFNAFCDRVPMLVLGATGPVDAAERRPWIDWLHTAADQGALVRSYVKWDDQPASAEAAVEAIARADVLTRTYPSAPVYVCLDAALQEAQLPVPIALPDPQRHRPPSPPSPRAAEVQAALELLQTAERPLLLMGRVGRDLAGWQARVRVAERLGARVLTDLKVGAAFPSEHPLHAAVPGTFLTASGRGLLRQADVVLSLDWVDLGGALRQAYGADPVAARVISCTTDYVLHNGWSKDHFELAPADLAIGAHPDLLVAALDELLHAGPERAAWPAAPAPAAISEQALDVEPPAVSLRRLAAALSDALGEGPTCLVRLPLGWDGADLAVDHPLDYLGQDGGAGLASGPGMVVGAALALAGGDRLAVAVLGDGDFLMGVTALWTAAHYRLPLLVVVANNRSYYNDEVHQERVARTRGRPVENRSVGQHIRDPDPDLAALGRSLGLEGHGPVTDRSELDAVLSAAVAQARAGAAVVVDVHVAPTGYPTGPQGVPRASP